jgi:RNA polymerase sigma-70 factor (ECF subfamily)
MFAALMSTFRQGPAKDPRPATTPEVPRHGAEDGAARAELATFEGSVRRTIACILHIQEHSPDVDDCVQETLRRAVEHRREARDAAAIRGWVLGIARHVALDEIRSRRRSRARTEPLDGEEARHDVPAQGPSPAEKVESQRELLRVSMALARLPDRQREALLLFHAEGVEYAEIGRRLGVPLGTVATWIARGRAQLHDLLSEDR